jgi:outer membrane biosynthesis protein TonB
MRPLAALLLGAVCALVVACGGSDDPGLLSAGRADNLQQELDAVSDAVANGDCEAAESAVSDLEQEIEELPRATDDRLVERLREGASNLRGRALEECGEQTDTTPTETAPPTVTETTPTETTPTETTPTETTPTETTPPEEEPPPDEQPPPEQQPPPEEEDPTGGATPGQGDGG